jgi:LmbE family N-acetylglucosaminyl deacetylase
MTGPAVQLDEAALAGSVLVVAHPDDEVLWFGSLLPAIGRVIIAFRDFESVPGIGARRAAAMAELPYRDLRCLDLEEAGSLGLADWADPTLTEFGIALSRAVDGGSAAQRYQDNFAALRKMLKQELAGCAHVFTHNPWGEYGHEDHVQLFRVIDALRAELGFELWTSTHCSVRSEALAKRYSGIVGSGLILCDVDRAFVRGVAEIYRKHDCWTWHADWVGPVDEWFATLPKETSVRPGEFIATPLTYVELPAQASSAVRSIPGSSRLDSDRG